MFAPVYIFLGAFLTVITALAIGRTILRRTSIELYHGEEDALGFVIGSAVLSLLIFALSALGWARKGVFLAVAAGAVLVVVRYGAQRNIRPRFAPLPRFWTGLFLLAFAVFTILYFFSAMAPEFSPDGTSYHLNFVAKYARARGFVRIPTNIYAQLSQGIELLFLMAFTFGRHSSAALVHYAFLLALSLAMVSYGRRIGYPIAGLSGAMLVYASPVVGIDGTSGYVDVAVACILFVLFYLLQIWDQQRRAGLLILIGIVAGFGYAAKYTAGFAIPYAAVYVAWRTRRIKPAVLVTGCALVLVAPWMIKDILWAGNPVAPMLNRVFPNPFVHLGFERSWTQYLRSYRLPTRWSIPLEVTMRGEKLCGLLGPMFLLAPLCIFALRIREGRRLLAAAALFSVPYAANIGTRFLIPALPFYAFSLALVLLDMRLLLGVALALHCILSWPSIAVLYTDPSPWMLNRIPLKAALRIESQDGWLARKHPDYNLATLIETNVPPKARVFSMTGLPESYITRDVLVRFQSAFAETLGDIFFSSYIGDYQPKCSERLQFAPQKIQRVRVVQTHPREWELEWTISELRLYSAGHELPRTPEWRITSRPNPWEIQLAFDNSPVTRWRSWQPFEPGMFVEIDLGRSQMVDTVQLEDPLDCDEHSLRVDAWMAGGKWTTIPSDRKVGLANPPQFMGKAAMRELKLRGVDYFFIRESEYGFPEIDENPQSWGLTEVAHKNDGHLYRLDAGYPQMVSDQNGTPISRR